MSGLATKYALNICKLKGGSARGVLTALAWRSAEKSPAVVYMPQEDICDCTGVTENTVRSAIKKLVAAHEVKVLKVGGVMPDGKRESTDFELVGVRQWIDAGCPPREEWQGAKAEPLGLKSCTLRPQELHPSKGLISEPTNQHHLHRKPESPQLTDNTQPQAPKQIPSLPLSERSEDSEKIAKFRCVRDALARLNPGDSGLDAWLSALQYSCDNTPLLAGRDVLAAWHSCREYREAMGLRKATRQDFAGWLLHEWPAAEAMVIDGSLAAA